MGEDISYTIRIHGMEESWQSFYGTLLFGKRQMKWKLTLRSPAPELIREGTFVKASPHAQFELMSADENERRSEHYLRAIVLAAIKGYYQPRVDAGFCRGGKSPAEETLSLIDELLGATKGVPPYEATFHIPKASNIGKELERLV